MKKDAMDRACSTHGGYGKYCNILAGKSEGKRQFMRARHNGSIILNCIVKK
jgi:nickel-dependent lactate racemase